MIKILLLNLPFPLVSLFFLYLGNPAKVNVGCFLFNSNEQEMVQGNIECLPCSSPIRLTSNNMNLTSEAEPTQNWASFSKYQVSKQTKDKSKESSSTGRGGNHVSKTSKTQNGNPKSRNNLNTKEKPSTTGSVLSSIPKDSNRNRNRNAANRDARSGETNARNNNTNDHGNEIANTPSTRKGNLHTRSSKTRNGNTRDEPAITTNIVSGGNKMSNTSTRVQNDNANQGYGKTKQKDAKPDTKNSNAKNKNSNNPNKNSKNSNASNPASKKKNKKRKSGKKSSQKQKVNNKSDEEMNKENNGEKNILLLTRGWKISSEIFTSVKIFLATYKWVMIIYITLLIIIIYNIHIAN